MNIFHELCDVLCVEPDALLRFSASSPHRYKVYTIPKRNGTGKRVIAHPSKELKYVQRALLELLLEILPVHDSAMAYRRGLGIRDNAMIHARSAYLLKMDFQNFFPSITPELYFKTLAESGIEISEKDRAFLEGVLFWKPVRKGGLVLSIGAPTSPLISNSLLYSFDEKIRKECMSKNVLYTRYADDLTFSTNKKGILFDVPDFVSNVLSNTLFDEIKINSNKTVFSSKAHNRHVTGITITNEASLSIGRARKRNISAAVHKYSQDHLNEEQIMSLKGLLAFAKHVEPAYFGRLQRKYGNDVIVRLMAFKKLK